MPPTRIFVTRRNNMFITRPHFGLCLSPLTVYHYHIRRLSPSPPSPSLCLKSVTRALNTLRTRKLGHCFPFLAILMCFPEQPNKLHEEETKETYRLIRRVPTHRRTTYAKQFGICHPGRNTNVIRASPL